MQTLILFILGYVALVIAASLVGAVALVVHEVFVARQWRRGDLWKPDGAEK